jgi:hypothetical protein
MRLNAISTALANTTFRRVSPTGQFVCMGQCREMMARWGGAR